MAQRERAARRASVPVACDSAPERFGDLIETLRERAEQDVLVDEYDKPILDALDEPRTAVANRDYLRGLYSTIKDCDECIRFSFLTGITKFSKTNLFSTLNISDDITLDPRYSAVCGYTERDLDTIFVDELPGLDRDRIRTWCNGYSWGGGEDQRVYNPYDVLCLFRLREFEPYWYETGSTEYFVSEIRRRGILSADLEGRTATKAQLTSFEVGAITDEALLFQTGYLTIRDSARDRTGRPVYQLGYPNLEVSQSLNALLLDSLARDRNEWRRQGSRLHDLLLANDFDGMRERFHSAFASIPHSADPGRRAARLEEAHYASVIYSHMLALGLDARMEEASSRGRADLTLRFNGHAYLFEFKMAERRPDGKRLSGDAARAIEQIKANGYAESHTASGQPVHLIGMAFSERSRNVADFATGTLPPRQAGRDAPRPDGSR